MLRKTLLFSILFMSFAVFQATAQTGTITGEVTDTRSGEPLPGANVAVLETQTGVAADSDGNYRIEAVEPGTYTLEASFVGYDPVRKEIEVPSGQEVAVDFELESQVAQMDEVVKIGIASERSMSRSEVSVSRIDAASLGLKNNNSNIADLIGGKSPGVSVESSAGSVGSGIRFRIRSGGGLKGDGQPAIYVDGTRIDQSEVEGTGAGGQGFGALSDLNPSEIEDINILKGPAAAAMYGVEGSSGVVLITTKGGSEDGLDVEFSSTVGQNEPHSSYSTNSYFTAEAANGELISGPLLQNQLSVSGNASGVLYYTSVTNRNENGIVQGDDLDRTSLRLNLDATPGEDFTIGVNTSYIINNQQRQELDNAFGPLNNTLFVSNEEVWSKTGSREAVYARSDVMEKNRFLGSANLVWSPIQDFQLQATAGLDRSNMTNNKVQPVGFSFGGDLDGQIERFSREDRQYNVNGNAKYSYNILSDLEATTTAGFQILDEWHNSLLLEKQTFPAEPIMDFGSGEDFLGSTEIQVNERAAGIFATQEFNYNDTYFTTLALRRDYASAVGTEAPNIFYPKASAAVRLDRFDLLPDAINFLKIRAAYGESGRLPGTLDAADLLYGANNTGYGAGAVVTRIGNPKVQPERVKEFETGFNAELLEKYSFDFTAYWTRARESIVGLQNSPSSGLTASSVPFNIGAIDGFGIENSVGVDVFQTSTSRLTTTLNWSYTTNEVKDLGRAQPIFEWDNVIKEGLPRAAFYSFQNNGALFNEDGTYAGADISTGEREFVGSPYANHHGSFEVQFTFLEDFDVYALSEWTIDKHTHNATNQIAERYGNLPKRIKLAAQLPNVDRFKDLQSEKFPNVEELEPGTDEHKRVANDYALLNPTSSKGYVEDSDYFTLSQVSIGYDATDLLRKFGAPSTLSSITIRVAANNLLFTTEYSDPDPRVHWQGARSIARGRDFTSLQQPRTWTLKLNLSF